MNVRVFHSNPLAGRKAAGLGCYSRQFNMAATGAGMVSDLAADRKLDKYSSLSSADTILPIAVNNLGGFST